MIEKTIKLRIPTSFKEWKQMRKERVDKRYMHNRKVVASLTSKIERAITTYWIMEEKVDQFHPKYDMSKEMREGIFYDRCHPDHSVWGCIQKALKELQ